MCKDIKIKKQIEQKQRIQKGVKKYNDLASVKRLLEINWSRVFRKEKKLWKKQLTKVKLKSVFTYAQY